MESNKEINQLSDAISRGTLSKEALAFLDRHLDALSNAVDSRIYTKINSSEQLDTNVLMQAYSEKNAYNNIRKTLSQTQRVGKSAGEKFKKVLEKDNGKGTDKRGINAAGSFSTYRG